MRAKALLGQRAAIWLLNQALPDAPDLVTLLRAAFITVAAGAAAGVATVALAALALTGLYELAVPYFGPGWAAASTLTVALLLIGAFWYLIDKQIQQWGKRRQLLRSVNNPLDHARDVAESLISGFLAGIAEKDDITQQVRSKVVKLRRKVVG